MPSSGRRDAGRRGAAPPPRPCTARAVVLVACAAISRRGRAVVAARAGPGAPRPVWIPKEDPAWRVNKLLVAGAGQMGTGIAQVSALAGLDVVMIDIADEFVQRGMAGIGKNLGRIVDKGRLGPPTATPPWRASRPAWTWTPAPTPTSSSRPRPRSSSSSRSSSSRPSRLLRADAIIATNTRACGHPAGRARDRCPERFVGIHFFNPVPLMALVEVVKRRQTSDETVAAARAFAEASARRRSPSTDSPGFVVNRILFPMINEAAHAFAEGVASAEDIDTGMKLGAN